MENRMLFTLDGARFDNLEGFYNEVERLFTRELGWRMGRNLDALNDILRGGFGVHEYGDPIAIRWVNHAKSVQDFGYPATVAYYRGLLERVHPLNGEEIKQRLRDAEQEKGQTLLDLILNVILDSDGTGHDCTLELVD